MTSAPGLQLPLGYQMMLQCQVLQGDTRGAYWWGAPIGKVQAQKEDTRSFVRLKKQRSQKSA
eukprot:1143853-Pelagomonas_calceolata.AAC.3